MKFDELLYSHLGEFGRYQRLQFFLVCVPTLFTAMHALSWTFTAANMAHRCQLQNETSDTLYGRNDTSSYIPLKCEKGSCAPDSCRRYEKPDVFNSTERCVDGYLYDHSEVANSAINRWEIVCDRSIIKAIIQACYYAGQFFGSLVFGFLGDRIGRKKVFFIAIVVQIISGALMSIVPFWPVFAILRMGVGFAHPGIFVIAVVIGMELLGPSMRKLAGVITGVFFALGQVVLGLIAYFIRDYQYLQLAISVPALVFMTYWWIVPESARWLVSHERYEEADAILQKAARMNKSTLPERWWEQLDKVEKPTETRGAERKYNLLDLIRTPVMRRRSICAFFCWPVVSMVYYGVSMNPTFLGGDLYVTFIFGAVMEIPALFLVYLLIDRIGRKPLLAGGFFVASLCMLSNILLPNDIKVINIAQYLITKAAITGTYATIYTFTPELFPTVIRNSAMGVCSMVARVGAVSASFIAMWLADISRLLVVIPFGSLALAAGVVALMLPETNGRPLPETIEEIEGRPVVAQEREMQELARQDKETLD